MRTISRALALLGVCLGCESPGAISSVRLGLVDVPERVNTVIAWAERVEDDGTRGEVVDSATVSVGAAQIELGVPVEEPIAFHVLAKTDRPGPAAFRNSMPAFVGSVVRTVALGQGQLFLPITAVPAGVLSIRAEARSRARLELLDEEGRRVRGLEPIAEGEETVSIALAVGRYSLVSADERLEVIGGQGAFVARERESIARVQIEPKRSVSPELPTALRIVAPDHVRTSSVGSTIDLQIEALADEAVEVPQAQVELQLRAEPASIVATTLLRADRLPARFEGLRFSGSGRVLLRATAELPQGRTLSASFAMNVLGPDESPGPVRSLLLQAEGITALSGSLFVSLLDGRAFFASRQVGELDVSASDPFLFFPDGPRIAMGAEDRGFLERRVTLPAAAEGLPVVLQGTFTSTTIEGTFTSSVTLLVGRP